MINDKEYKCVGLTDKLLLTILNLGFIINLNSGTLYPDNNVAAGLQKGYLI